MVGRVWNTPVNGLGLSDKLLLLLQWRRSVADAINGNGGEECVGAKECPHSLKQMLSKLVWRYDRVILACKITAASIVTTKTSQVTS
jgi:hypothetical protein